MKRIGTRSYIRTLIKDPNVASITPTSTFGIKKLLSSVNFSKARLFVEYGPGGGVITKAILKKMSPDARLVAIEQNQSFAQALQSNLIDHRLVVINDTAENVELILKNLEAQGVITEKLADHIISGIPFSMFSLEVKNKILSITGKCLKPTGSFLVYQFLISLSAGKNDIKRKIREFFDIRRSEVELRNVPPLRIFEGLPKNELVSSKNAKAVHAQHTKITQTIR